MGRSYRGLWPQNIYFCRPFGPKTNSTESAPRRIQSLGRNVLLFVCPLSVPSNGTGNRLDWRLLVKERIAKIAKLRRTFVF